MTQFQVTKNNFKTGRLVAIPALEKVALKSGEIVVKIDCFGYTANNITYAAVGEQLRYWEFFPPYGEKEHDQGVIPVWGFADVVASTVVEVPVGDRLFGYFPPATYLVMQPVGVSPFRLIDGMPHRSDLPAGYNNYSRVLAEPDYDRARDHARMVLAPLHMTAYFLWDTLKEKEWYGAEQVLLLSASSKTSTGLAFALREDPQAPPVVGLTSAKNKKMVEQTGLYDQVFTYEEIAAIDASIPTVMVDMAGNIKVLLQLYRHLGEQRKFCVNVGITHWGETGRSKELAPRSEFFFAPSQIQKRIKDWGMKEFQAKTTAFLMASTRQTMGWLRFEIVEGMENFAQIHERVCAGAISGDVAIVVVL